MQSFTVDVDGVSLDIVRDTDGTFIIPDHLRGLGTALKPAMELVCLARKPLSEKTIAANVLRWGTGALNIDWCRVGEREKLKITDPKHGGHEHNCYGAPSGGGKLLPPGRWPANVCHDGSEEAVAGFPTVGDSHPPDNEGTVRTNRIFGEDKNQRSFHPGFDDSAARFFYEAKADAQSGRWPANVCHDGSEEVVAGFPESAGQQGDLIGTEPSECFGNVRNGPKGKYVFEKRGDSGSAARFFYTSKADSDDRLGSKHPTVKPVSLIQWLCRLICPPSGTILDCFAGTGTTGEAALREGFKAVLIEREDSYCTDIRRRMQLAMAGPDERLWESIKARGKVESPGPLFD